MPSASRHFKLWTIGGSWSRHDGVWPGCVAGGAVGASSLMVKAEVVSVGIARLVHRVQLSRGEQRHKLGPRIVGQIAKIVGAKGLPCGQSVANDFDQGAGHFNRVMRGVFALAGKAGFVVVVPTADGLIFGGGSLYTHG